MVFGLSFDKLIVVAVVAFFLIGPERIPGYAAKLGKFVRSARDFARNAQERVREEMGPEFDDVDWTKLDPRQYDPRRIIREALLEDSAAITNASARTATFEPFREGAIPPFDSEAT